MIIGLAEAAELKRAAAEKFSSEIHFHDGCGGQYFTVDKPAEELKAFITEFLALKNMKPVFYNSDEAFRVEKAD
ncbi:MAG: hypothetical protein ACI4KR_06600 [Ruminiclostridium sp.]